MAISPASFPLEEVVGQFKHKETGCFFDFKKNLTDELVDYEYMVFVGPEAAEFRYARIGKTVAYVVIDEDEYGFPIEEKWPINMQWSRECVSL